MQGQKIKYSLYMTGPIKVTYSPTHIHVVNITFFLFLHEYCKEKAELTLSQNLKLI